MKGLKVALASLLACGTIFSLTACAGCSFFGSKEKTYEVTYTVGGEESKVEVAEGAIPQKPADPTKDGYVFKGWFLDAACTQSYNFDTPLTENQTLYAHFVAVYSVNFYMGADTSIPTQTMEVNQMPQRPADPQKDGFIFKGWFLDAAYTQAYNFDTALNVNSTLYAQFDEMQYKVTYVVDGVENEVTFLWSQTPSLETPKKDGYVFKYWCADEDLTEEYAFTQPVQADVTVYAKFVPAYKVEFVITDGENKEVVETENETIPLRPADPKVEGYDFMGWFLDSAFTQEYLFDSVLAPETTLYAKLVEKQYVVSFVTGEGGSEIAPITYKWSQIPQEPAKPINGDKYFFGWYLDEAYTQSYLFNYSLQEDTTLYAQFLDSKPIYTLEDLTAIAEYPSGSYTLMNDINLGYAAWTPIAAFSGKLDGNGHKLVAFSIASTTSASLGFILNNTGTVKNLTLESVSFSFYYTNASTAGVLAATNNGTIENCHLNKITASYSVEGGYAHNYFGGLVGRNESNGVMDSCTVKAVCEVMCYAPYKHDTYCWFGGIAAYNGGQIRHTLIFADINGRVGADSGSSGDYSYSLGEIGGLVGQNAGNLTKSGYEGNITLASSKPSRAYTYLYVGGAVRTNVREGGTISQCYAKGSIVETAGSLHTLALGGFAQDNGGIIKDCYADMDITTGTAVRGWVGGFVSVNGNVISTSYATGEIDTKSTGQVGGFVANNTAGGAVNGSLCSVNITSSAASNLGVFQGYADAGSNVLNSVYNAEASVTKADEAYVSPAVSGVSGVDAAALYSTSTVLDTLYWNVGENVWHVDGENAPTLLWENSSVVS